MSRDKSKINISIKDRTKPLDVDNVCSGVDEEGSPFKNLCMEVECPQATTKPYADFTIPGLTNRHPIHPVDYGSQVNYKTTISRDFAGSPFTDSGEDESPFKDTRVENDRPYVESLIGIRHANGVRDYSGDYTIPSMKPICSGDYYNIDKSIKPKEEDNMNEKTAQPARRVVKVYLLDDDPSLNDNTSKVFGIEIVSSSDNESIIREVLYGVNIKEVVESHNKKRAEVVDKTILRTTGNKVNLFPVELTDLRWVVTSA